MGLFGSRPDHPLADPKEAKRLLEALPANDPVKSLDELMHWMESVAAAEGFKPEARIQPAAAASVAQRTSSARWRTPSSVCSHPEPAATTAWPTYKSTPRAWSTAVSDSRTRE